MPLGPDQGPPRGPQDQKNEVVRLQSEITNEVARDAPEIALGIFGNNKSHPDMTQVSNQQLDDVYRQKYIAQDREWLQAEAKRDPQQFLDVSKRIGVSMPQPGEPAPVTAPPPAPAPLTAAPPAPAPPMPVPAAVPPPASMVPPAPLAQPGPLQVGAAPGAVPPGAAPPLILGPNGQPLPPSGVG
jgi:hypothetical protein